MKAATGSIVVALAFLAGCGGSGGGGSGSCAPGATATVKVGSAGFSPKAVCVLPAGSVTFTNTDTVAHDIESGMVCLELNLGPIPAGQSATATFPTAQTCSFFDAAHSTDAAFEGTVAVTSGTVSGPGY